MNLISFGHYIVLWTTKINKMDVSGNIAKIVEDISDYKTIVDIYNIYDRKIKIERQKDVTLLKI